MAREHPKIAQSCQHFDRMAEQYDTLFVPHVGGYNALQRIGLNAIFPRRFR
jgi:hypothetical protein